MPVVKAGFFLFLFVFIFKKKWKVITIQDYNKSGQVGGSVGAVIGLIVGIGIAVLVLIFVGALGGQTYELVEDDIDALTAKVINDSITVLNNTAVALSNDDVVANSLATIRIASINDTHCASLNNYTFDLDAGTVTLLAPDVQECSGTLVNFSYTHGSLEVQNSIKSGIMSSFEALEKTGDYLPIIVLAFVISIVLFLVLGMTGMVGGGEGRTGAL